MEIGTSIFATKYLSKNIRVVGYLSLIGGFFLLLPILFVGLWENLEALPIVVVLLLDAVVLFSISYGVSKKEKWAHIFGIILVAISLFNTTTQLLSGVSILFLLVVFMIEISLLLSLIRAIKEGIVNTISKLPLVLAVIGIVFILVALFFGPAIVYQIKNPIQLTCSIDSDCPIINKPGWTCDSYCEAKRCEARCSQPGKLIR